LKNEFSNYKNDYSRIFENAQENMGKNLPRTAFSLWDVFMGLTNNQKPDKFKKYKFFCTD
jgi:hypothetical protein